MRKNKNIHDVYYGVCTEKGKNNNNGKPNHRGENRTAELACAPASAGQFRHRCFVMEGLTEAFHNFILGTFFEHSTAMECRISGSTEGIHIDLRDSNEQINPASDACEFVYDRASGVLCCRLTGRVTDERITEYYVLASSYISKINPLAGIVDLSGVTSFEISTQTVKNLAAAPPAFPDNRPRIIVAPAPYIFGMIRMFQILGEATRPMLEVVRSMKEAYALLGIKECSFQPVVID